MTTLDGNHKMRNVIVYVTNLGEDEGCHHFVVVVVVVVVGDSQTSIKPWPGDLRTGHLRSG
jgi:hypothetical protein